MLETDLETDDGEVRLIDFMPVRNQAPDIVRIVEGRRGRVPMRLDLVIRFDNGRVLPWVRQREGALTAVAGPNALCLRGDIPTRGEDLATVGDFTIAQGERRAMIATWFASHEPLPAAIDPEDALRDTESWWREWSGRCTYDGPWREAVLTSLMVLKALTFGPTGGIVAAPTTSLPEWPGGVRNWDYRYCWLRDATMTLYVLMLTGYTEEAAAWREWLLRAAAGDPARLQIMYGVSGERRLAEYEADWLPGYEGSSPCASATRRTSNCSWTSMASCRMRCFRRAASGSGGSVGLGFPVRADGFAGVALDRARRRDLGGAWTAPPLHALQGDVLGGVRSCDQDGPLLLPPGAAR